MAIRRKSYGSEGTVDLQALDARMAAQEQNSRDVWGMTQRLVAHFDNYCEHRTIAQRQGWLWRLENAARAKAEIIAQASYDSWEVAGRLVHQLVMLPTPYETKEKMPDYVRDLYREWRGNRNPSLNFTEEELLHMSCGEYSGAQQQAVVM
jgi:hypothetical protein